MYFISCAYYSTYILQVSVSMLTSYSDFNLELQYKKRQGKWGKYSKDLKHRCPRATYIYMHAGLVTTSATARRGHFANRFYRPVSGGWFGKTRRSTFLDSKARASYRLNLAHLRTLVQSVCSASFSDISFRVLKVTAGQRRESPTREISEKLKFHSVP